jgi:hypothetical protein
MKPIIVRLLGWSLIVLAIAGGLMTVPVLHGHGWATDGSMEAHASPLHTEVSGQGTFHFQTEWGISWVALAVSLAVLACGVLLVRRMRPAA